MGTEANVSKFKYLAILSETTPNKHYAYYTKQKHSSSKIPIE